MYRLLLPRESLRGPDGLRLGAAAGASLDFHDFRDYHPGDDLRRLDWGVYARTDREVVRLYREEICPHLDLFVDTSASMSLPGTRKAEALASLLSTLSAAATAAHCSFARHGSPDERPECAAQAVPASAQRPECAASVVPASGLRPECAAAVVPASGLRPECAAKARAHSIRIFISDLLFPSDPAPLLAPLADGAAALHVVQLLAAEEEDPALSGAHELVDAETGERLEALLDAPTLASYRAALAAHRDRWHQACRRLGATLSTLTDATVLTPPGRLLPLEQNAVLEPL